MNKNEKCQSLLNLLKEHKPLEIYLEEDYYSTFTYEDGWYVSQFGKISIENLYKAINGLLPHIEVKEVTDEIHN